MVAIRRGTVSSVRLQAALQPMCVTAIWAGPISSVEPGSATG
jgi:hypothetical protein